MLEFDIKSPQDTLGVVKATVHKSGKLGFSSGAIKMLGLENEGHRYYKVATNKADSEDDSLYLIVASKGEEDVFKASKAGQYYYLRVKHVLDEMTVDYKNEKVIYDIRKVEEKEIKYYKLTRRKPISRAN
ncbi:hypothetical protein JMN32_03635 [Fulvivirga sp. 29W222]|uniref:Uncharacterized protein n=1 Tax=Fulvivirga marina TaxID=2494733 RepID=A0A937KCM4_9BACT|nr:hypothetical protein [Fulvivirga marina]MBL6445383.1 hypothetical protein [Fulvivirga marina]